MGRTKRQGGKQTQHHEVTKKFSYKKGQKKAFGEQKVKTHSKPLYSGNETSAIGSGYIPGVTPIQKPDMKLPLKGQYDTKSQVPAGKRHSIVPRVTVLDTDEVKVSIGIPVIGNMNDLAFTDNSGLELATVKFFNDDPSKLFGFATTDLPNESGTPELFFHLGGGSEFSAVGKDKIEMVFFQQGGECPAPLMGDRIVFMRGYGVKGEKIVKWGFLIDLKAGLNECDEFISPTYRLVKEVRLVGNRENNKYILWEGSDLGDLVSKFPIKRDSRIKCGLVQDGQGTSNTFFEQYTKECDLSTQEVSSGMLSCPWQRCEDPRVGFLRR